MAERLLIHMQSCKGCGYCVQECPKEALSLDGTINLKGYATVKVNTQKCICCGICYTVCPDYVFEIEENTEK